MKKLLCLVFAAILQSSISFGQISNITGVGNEVLKLNKYTDVEGSPYLYADWKPGTVTDKEGKVFSNVMLKYDAYKDCIEINQDGKMMVLNGTMYSWFTINFVPGGSNDVIYREFKNHIDVERYPATAYFEVIYSGEIQLLKKLDIDFIEENVSNYGTSASVKEFRRKERLFMIIDGKGQEVKLNKKSIMPLLEKEGSKLEDYMKQNKNKLKSEEDLIELIKYCEAL